jgi:hypothetical protein
VREALRHRPEAERRATVGGEPADHLADGRSAEIKLRQGVRFNDDTPLDAEAVKKSLDRHLALEGSQRKSELLAVTGSTWSTRRRSGSGYRSRSRRCRRCWPTVPVWSCRPSSSTSSAPTPAVQNHRTSGTTASEERRRQPHAFLPDIWSHEAEPEPTPDYHQA